MRRPALALALAALAALWLCGVAVADEGFGIKNVAASFAAADGSDATQAGSHPFSQTVSFEFNTAPVPGGEAPIDATKDLRVELPPGFTGDPLAVPRCSNADFFAHSQLLNTFCPDDSAIGRVDVPNGVTEPFTSFSAVYNLQPPPGVVARIGFIVPEGFIPFTIDLGIKPTPPYNLIAEPTDIPQVVNVYGSSLTVWGVPGDPAHDPFRGACNRQDGGSHGSCPTSLPERPLLLMPRSCTGPLTTTLTADSWQDPGTWLAPIEAHSPAMNGCTALSFGPRISARPTNPAAESPSGLDFGLDVEDEGLANPAGLAQSDIRKAVVTLPEGMTIDPSQAEGLGVCSEAQLEAETASSAPGEGCPQASKIGTVEVETPLLEGEILKGALFVAAPYANRFGTLLALYMTIKDPKLGINVVLAGKVEPDPRTGQLITTFGEAPYELPQQPFSHFRLHFREGGRSPLVTPPLCGKYQVEAEFTPWANPSSTYETSSPFEVTQGPNGGPCPAAGTPPFHPGFEAGTSDNAAGGYSPFHMRLTRRDGDQDMTKFSAVLPPGVVGKIAGLAKCPQASVEAAKARTGPHGGAEELARPSCPADSLIGHTLSGAGVGPELTYVPGFLYLGGPYHGDPLSVVAITPAVAGPFDAGTVVVQVALTLNPVSGEVEVDGSASDPIPHILKGIPLKVRDIRIDADRPDFTLNPTSCEPEQTRATLWGGGADVFSAADDGPFALSAPFQAANCAALGFEPQLALRLKGGTKRGRFPALNALYTPRPGDANLSRLLLRFPHSEFIEQGHFRTICTRVQFAAGAGNGADCPQGSAYGQVEVWTPLLSEPLSGPVYLRSSNHNLPDAVFALASPIGIHIEVSVRIDSAHGGLRATVEGAPDAPVSKAVVRMAGAQKGLFVNSVDLCSKPKGNRANADLTGQNGLSHRFHPPLRPDCGRKGHGAARSK